VKRWSGLAWRTAGASVLLGALTAVATGSLAYQQGVKQAVRLSARLYAGPLLATYGAACRASPGGWSLTTPEGLTVLATDAAHPLAAPRAPASGPGLDPTLLARRAQGEAQPVVIYFPRLEGRSWGGGVLVPVADSGPCSLLEYRWPPLHDRRLASLRWVLLAAITSTSLAVALSTAFVIYPLLRRLSRLHRAAGGLGGPGYSSTQDTLGDELGDLARVLDTTHARVLADAERIQEQKRALERFLSNVAHDLKTPLASLQLALELAASTPPEELSELLVQGMEDTVYLTALVDNLRLACLLGEGLDPLDDEPRAELGMIVGRVVRRLGLLARRKDITLEAAHPDPPIWVRCNPTLLEQGVSNLLHNALTHGDAGGHVVAVLEEVGPGGFRLTVLDDGPGLPSEELERLGERLFRSGEARRRDPRGSGLGIAIVRELCRRAGLTLTFEPNAPRGLKVVIEGPRAH
jgi:signal transduction histidine kinase